MKLSKVSIGAEQDLSGICSIDQLSEDLLKDDFLLSQQRKDKRLISLPKQDKVDDDESSFLDVYITPYVKREERQPKRRQQQQTHARGKTQIKPQVKKISKFEVGIDPFQDATIAKDDIIKHRGYQCIDDGEIRQNMKEVHRLKRILSKKNTIIAELNSEISYLTKKINLSFLNKIKENPKDINFDQSLFNLNLQKSLLFYHQKEDAQIKKQMEFLKSNNQQLYDLMLETKAQNFKLQQQVDKMTKINEKIMKKLNKLNKQNDALKICNTQLLKNAKQCIQKGQKEIKLFQKMRVILAEKNTVTNSQKQIHIDKQLEKQYQRKMNLNQVSLNSTTGRNKSHFSKNQLQKNSLIGLRSNNSSEIVKNNKNKPNRCPR